VAQARSYDPLKNYAGRPADKPRSNSGEGQLLPRRVLPNAAAQQQLEAGTAERVHPVGSLFLTIVATDPSDISSLGFGTWALYAEGQALVGFKQGDANFGTVGVPNGTKQVTPTVATQPTFSVNSHTHPLSSNGYALISVNNANPAVIADVVTVSSWTGQFADSSIGATDSSNQTKAVPLAGATDGATAATTRTQNVVMAGSSVIQPSMPIYVWVRTA
jgi:hypothetical protein